MGNFKFVERALILAALICLFSCGMLAKNQGASSSNSTLGWSMKNSSLSQQAISILSSSCVSCHGSGGQGGVSNITDPTTLLNSGLVAPGNPAGSTLITSITMSGMPQGGSLGSAQLQTLESWIQTEFIQTVTSPGANPTPSPSPPPLLGGSDPVVNAQVSTLFQNHCVSCHGPSSGGSGGFNYITDVTQLVSKGLIVPGNAAGSLLYQKVNGGTMQGYLGSPTTDLPTLNSWISTMSANPTPLPSPSIVPLTPTFASIQANILTPSCVGCHNGKQETDLTNYAAVFKHVTAGNAAGSSLYKEIDSGGDMHKYLGNPTADLQAVSTWITNGALNN